MKIPVAGKGPGVPVVAMADIAFLLLVFLLVTSALDQSRNLRIDIPSAPEVTPLSQEQAFTVFVDRDGGLYHKGRRMELAQLDFLFLRHRSFFKDPLLQVVGDANVPYEKVNSVIETLRKKSPLRVGFICKEEETP